MAYYRDLREYQLRTRTKKMLTKTMGASNLSGRIYLRIPKDKIIVFLNAV